MMAVRTFRLPRTVTAIVGLSWLLLIALKAVVGGWPGTAAAWIDLLLNIMPPLVLLMLAMVPWPAIGVAELPEATDRPSGPSPLDHEAGETTTALATALDARCQGGRAAATSLAELLPQLASHADSVASRLGRMETDSLRQLGTLDGMLQRMRAAHEDVSRRMDADAARLAEQLAGIDARSRDATEAIARRAYVLDAAIDAVLERSESAVAGIEHRVGEQLRRLEAQLSTMQSRLDRMGERGVALLAERSALFGQVAETLHASLTEVDSAMHGLTERATEASGQFAGQVSEHVAYLEERLGQLEARVATAAARSDAAAREELASQGQQLLASLGELSAEVVRLLSVDVPETAWAGFLAGDRSVFARQAARMADGDMRRRLARLYAQDPEFRSRATAYAARFEELLSRVLPDREGEALGLALLSSDYGKLYVLISESVGRVPTAMAA